MNKVDILKYLINMHPALRRIKEYFLCKLDITIFENISVYTILNKRFSELKIIPTYERREQLWELALEITGNNPICYIEFGVFEGKSINYFAKSNPNPESAFIGLDSFEGLPENWGSMSKGTFNLNGATPFMNDGRVTFIKGWFQNTWQILEQKYLPYQKNKLIVHYDADLYSSTLFALTKIDQLNKPYIAIFDEFFGQETRALLNYIQAYNAKVRFIAKTPLEKNSDKPAQMICEISPCST
jgi:hypothetical protein